MTLIVIALLWGISAGALHDSFLQLLKTDPMMPGVIFIVALGLLCLPVFIFASPSYRLSLGMTAACTLGSAVGLLLQQHGCVSLIDCANRVSNVVSLGTGLFLLLPTAMIVTYFKRRTMKRSS